VDFRDLANHPAPDEFDDAPAIVAGVALIAHLGDQVGVLPGQGQQAAAFLDRVGEGLLHIDVDATLHGHAGGDGVVVVGCGDQDSVDVFPGVEHLAVVGESRGPVVGVAQGFAAWKQPRALVQHAAPDGVVVDVAGGHDVLVGQLVHVDPALSASADDGDIDLVAGGERPRGEGRGGQCGGACAQQATARQVSVWCGHGAFPGRRLSCRDWQRVSPL
jgi:hypothetical protein